MVNIGKIRGERGCLLCDEHEPCCLHFHHLGGKKFTIGGNAHKKWSDILAEIEKCIVLCANCHMKLHAGVKQLPPMRVAA